MDGIGKVLDAYNQHLFNQPGEADTLGALYERKSTNVKIKFVGVWETVGSLGIPDLYIFGIRASLFDYFLGKINEKYQWSDTNLHPNIEFAIHA